MIVNECTLIFKPFITHGQIACTDVECGTHTPEDPSVLVRYF